MDPAGSLRPGVPCRPAAGATRPRRPHGPQGMMPPGAGLLVTAPEGMEPARVPATLGAETEELPIMTKTGIMEQTHLRFVAS